MTDYKQQALGYLERNDFDGLHKFCADPPDGFGQFADEIKLLSFAKQGFSNSRLERPFENYVSKYGFKVPVENLIALAKIKFELSKFEDALGVLTSFNVSRDQKEASEIAILCLFNLKRWEPGLALVNNLIEIEPTNPQYREWGILFNFKLFNNEAVLEYWHKFLDLEGVFTQKLTVLGYVIRTLLNTGQLEEANTTFEAHNLEAFSNDVDIAMLKADMLKQAGDFQGCVNLLEQAAGIHPDIVELRWNLSLAQLASGDLAKGWENYECRWQWRDFPSAKRVFSAPMWDGSQDLDGNSILIWGEQGVGDQLRFLTLLPSFIADNNGARIYLEVDPRLVKLVRTWFPEVEDVWPMGIDDTRGVADYDNLKYQMPSGSLPLHYFSDAGALDKIAYRTLDVSLEKKEALLGTFASEFDCLIGVSWRSMLTAQGRIADYVNVRGIKKIIESAPPGVGFVVLQYSITEEEREAFADMNNVYVPKEDFLNDMEANALYAGACDLLVSCGTVVATMAGIFGRPVISWSKFDDAVNLGQEHNPWFPNRFDIRVMPNWSKVELVNKLSRIENSYLESQSIKNPSFY